MCRTYNKISLNFFIHCSQGCLKKWGKSTSSPSAYIILRRIVLCKQENRINLQRCQKKATPCPKTAPFFLEISTEYLLCDNNFVLNVCYDNSKIYFLKRFCKKGGWHRAGRGLEKRFASFVTFLLFAIYADAVISRPLQLLRSVSGVLG